MVKEECGMVKAAVDYSVLSWYSAGGTKEKHVKPQRRQKIF
jgi:hypothetical protein